MAIVKTDAFAIDLNGVTAIRTRPSIWSMIPKAIAAAAFVFSLYAVAYFGGALIGMFDDKVSNWDETGSIVLGIGTIGVFLLIAFAAARLVVSDDVSGQARATVSWLLLLAALLALMGAAFSYNTVMSVQETGGSFGDNHAARLEFITQQNDGASMGIGFAVLMVAAFLSLRLVGRKNVFVSRGGVSEKIPNVRGEDAIRIREAAGL